MPIGRVFNNPFRQAFKKITSVATVTTLPGFLFRIPLSNFAKPVVFTKTGGSQYILIDSSTGVVTSTTGIPDGTTQTISGYATGSDGVVIPFDLTFNAKVFHPTLLSKNSEILTRQDGSIILGYQ